jgi:hypothetical protein
VSAPRHFSSDEITEEEAGRVTGLGWDGLKRRRQRYESVLGELRRAQDAGALDEAKVLTERLARINIPPFTNFRPGLRYSRSLCEAWRKAHEHVPPAFADLAGATPRPEVPSDPPTDPSSGDESATEAP